LYDKNYAGKYDKYEDGVLSTSLSQKQTYDKDVLTHDKAYDKTFDKKHRREKRLDSYGEAGDRQSGRGMDERIPCTRRYG
jgi:hypothetical protein